MALRILAAAFLAIFAASAISQTTAQEDPHVSPKTPAATPSAHPQLHVEATLPNGRQIHPEGAWLPLAPYPFAIALKPDGSQAAIPSIGFPFSLNIIDKPDTAESAFRLIPSRERAIKQGNDPSVEVHDGLAYSPDGALLYVATGNSGKVAVYSTADWKKTAEIPLDASVAPGKSAPSFAASILISADGKTLFVLDQGNWRVVVVDVSDPAKGRVAASVPTGAYPFGQALSEDGHRLYVTNIGLFEYKAVPGADPKNELATGLHFAPFGYPSRQAREGITAEGKKIPGLGPENSDRGSSLWTYNVEQPSQPKLTARLRLGSPITELKNGQVGGAAPTGVIAGGDSVYVSLAHQDSVARVSGDGTKLLGETPLSPFTAAVNGKKLIDAQGRPLRGVMPSGLALRDNRLYVAESGIDAVAVLDVPSMKLLYHLPVGWNPSAVKLSPDGKMLYVVNTKGKGAGPNGGKDHDSKSPTYIGALELGSLSIINLATLPSSEVLTETVIKANTYALAQKPALPKLKHCFLVVRENRTFDEVLGDVAGVNGDTSLARYGMDGWAEERGKSEIEASHLRVTPNMHALAGRYAISDNYYVDSDVSADGHRWVVGINPTAFFNTAWTSGYGGRRKEDVVSPAPGRRALFGGSDSPMPEDEPQFGTIWEHIADSGLGILNYGEGIEIEGGNEIDGSAPEGQRLMLNSPVPKPIFESTDRKFPTFNLGIPDQFRVEEFERDFSRRLKLKTIHGKPAIPGLIVIRLPNDHTADPRPADGYPYRASYVADNDLALGRIIDYLSKTEIWKDSALFVTEDDAQGGVDHIDAHRSPLLVASPWVKPGTISHGHASMGSITRTMDELLGLGPLNLEDALAGDLTEIFASGPDLSPFTFVPSDGKVFDPAKAKIAVPKTRQEAAALRNMDDSEEIQKHLEKTKSKLRRPAKADND